MKIYNIYMCAAVFALLLSLGSCRKMDDYKEKFLGAGTITYAGKIDSVKAHPGDGRLMISGLLIADPKIKLLKIFWNNKADSFVMPINRTAGIDTVRAILNNMEEAVKSFTILTYDEYGNQSVDVTIAGRVYGPVYKSLLLNRTVKDATMLGDSVNVQWNVLDASTGGQGSELQFTDNNNAIQKLFVPRTQELTVLKNFKPGSRFSYRTVFLPDTLAIDTFYSGYQEVGVTAEVTKLYMKNAGPNFTNSDGTNERWQTPADWTTTADVRNGDGGRGGLDNGSWLPSKALSLEAWWGMPEIPNGKIYQTFTLPAGRYSFIATAGDCSDGGTKYITIAAGNELPDIANVPSQAIVYKTIAKNSDNKVDFTLAADTQVSIGLQGKLPAEGNFMKVFKVQLYSLP